MMAVLFGSAGLVPALVSPIVDSLREHKESRQAREDHYEVMEELEKRNVAAMEQLAGINPPADGREDASEAPAMVFQKVLETKEREAGAEAQDATGKGRRAKDRRQVDRRVGTIPGAGDRAGKITNGS